MSPTPGTPLVSVADYEHAARDRFDARARAFIDGGAGDELTVADNASGWDRLALLPRVFTGAADPDPGVTLLGRRRAHPLVVAPVAFAGLAHPDAERGMARAAADTGTVMCVSTFSGVAPEALRVVAPEAPRWFQLYVLRDRGATRELVQAAHEAGCEALVVTGDRPVLGIRDAEARLRMRDAAPEPGVVGGPAPVDTAQLVDPSVSWADVERLAADSPLPLIVKGVLTPADARRAHDHGAAAVIVSNHGGRQLDTTPIGGEVLPGIVDAVGGELDVLVDGGVRRGTDVVKALALGARGVMVGRPLLWGLAVDGADGARRVLEILLHELSVTLALVGVSSAAELDAGYVVAR